MRSVDGVLNDDRPQQIHTIHTHRLQESGEDGVYPGLGAGNRLSVLLLLLLLLLVINFVVPLHVMYISCSQLVPAG